MSKKDDDKSPKMMDESMPEGESNGYTPTPRNVYALDTLLREVDGIFPDMPFEIVGKSRFGAGIAVQFETTGDLDLIGLYALLNLIKDDNRVQDVTTEDVYVVVEFWDAPPIMDLRDPFNLAAAWAILNDPDEDTSAIEGGDADSTSSDEMDGGGA